ncbi:heparan-sulfate 6-O-sulfotransferase 2-like [Eulemur rufifrons]|uniref:heparan-sulfate 6-O-sulfotransferase 2-like n=1 Tax=Eulemur rufifrons TaxID=859984 RepID=UPI0037425B0E
MALPACAARALGQPLQPERRAPARTTCPRRHSRVEAELAESRPGSVAASVRAGSPRGVSHGFNSRPLRDEPLKASSSLTGAERAPLFALLSRGRRRRMHDLRRRWDLGSLCRALLTRGLAALGHSLKHVLGAIFSRIFGPLASVGNMDEKSNKLLLALVMLFLFAVIVLQYVCPGTECQLLRLQAFSSPVPDPYRSEDESSVRFVPRYNFTRGDLLRKVDFDIKGDDLIVFLHIQKTGGTTFGRHLVRNIQLEQPCECRVGQKKCTCHRPGKRETWLFSRFSTGWSCGLHADWTELTSCVPSVVDGKRDARLRPSSWAGAGFPGAHVRRAVAASGIPCALARDGHSVCPQGGLRGGGECVSGKRPVRPNERPSGRSRDRAPRSDFALESPQEPRSARSVPGPLLASPPHSRLIRLLSGQLKFASEQVPGSSEEIRIQLPFTVWLKTLDLIEAWPLGRNPDPDAAGSGHAEGFPELSPSRSAGDYMMVSFRSRPRDFVSFVSEQLEQAPGSPSTSPLAGRARRRHRRTVEVRSGFLLAERR